MLLLLLFSCFMCVFVFPQREKMGELTGRWQALRGDTPEPLHAVQEWAEGPSLDQTYEGQSDHNQAGQVIKSRGYKLKCVNKSLHLEAIWRVWRTRGNITILHRINMRVHMHASAGAESFWPHFVLPGFGLSVTGLWMKRKIKRMMFHTSPCGENPTVSTWHH